MALEESKRTQRVRNGELFYFQNALWGFVSWGSGEFWRSVWFAVTWGSILCIGKSLLSGAIHLRRQFKLQNMCKGKEKSCFLFLLNTSSVYHAVQIMGSPGSRHWFCQLLTALGSVCCGARPAATFASHEVDVGAVTVEYWQKVATIIAAKMVWIKSWSIFLFFPFKF